MPVGKDKITKGRKAVDAYRDSHLHLYDAGWHEGISEEHTPLLKVMVDALEGLSFTSTETEFEPKKDKILADFWDASDDLNIEELGYKDKEDFEKNATDADKEKLKEMWH